MCALLVVLALSLLAPATPAQVMELAGMVSSSIDADTGSAVAKSTSTASMRQRPRNAEKNSPFRFSEVVLASEK